MRRILRGAAIPAGMVVLWEILSHTGTLPMDTMSRPSHIALAAAQGFADGTILLATWHTLQAAFFGFAIASTLGVLFGIILGLSPRLECVVSPSVEALRPVPAVALMPLSLLLFGFGLQMEAFVVAFACIWPVLLVTITAVHGIEPRLLDVARALEMTFAERIRKIILPAALGRIVVGLRLAFGISLIVAVTVEIVINPRGLGYDMITAQQSLKPELMYAELLWLGLLGWALNFAATKTVTRWPAAHVSGEVA